MKTEKHSEPNQSSDKLLSLLELMAEQQEPLRLQDIAKLSGMNSSTVLRFLLALERRNYVAQDMDTNRYYLTFKLCALAGKVNTYNSIRKIAPPFMRGVVSTFKETCNLAVENDQRVLYIEVMNNPSNTLFTTQRIGNVAPMHCTGIGKLFLAEYSPAELEKYIAIRKLERYTDFTITSRAALEEELQRIRENGYAFDNQECEYGARCIAVPIRDYSGKIHAGLSVSGPTIRMTDEHIYGHLDYLKDTAAQLSTCMGYQK